LCVLNFIPQGLILFCFFDFLLYAINVAPLRGAQKEFYLFIPRVIARGYKYFAPMEQCYKEAKNVE
jgi:predicted permease